MKQLNNKKIILDKQIIMCYNWLQQEQSCL
nr:MAG TPA: hypothetical protein [Caudoviricetes sp.]